MSRKILFALSSHGALGSTGFRTGSWLEEIAAPYWCMVDGGYEVVLASPKGGAAPIDPTSVKDAWISEAGRRFLDDPVTIAAIANTARLADVEPSDYLGLFMAGGAATTWDFPLDPSLKSIVERYHAEGKVIGGVCHGVIGLVRAEDANGEPLVKNRNITSISNAEDVIFGLDKVVPVLPEDMLRKMRANYSCAAPFAENVVLDPPFFTGQNPASAAPLAKAILSYLDRATAKAALAA